ncbi:MAG: hypothetical protein HQ510_06710 [Candidatus Marinimicrobia bacterium]|nr:hypothetical protein [Candidatus Neomarinimicrobiota bacterium]
MQRAIWIVTFFIILAGAYFWLFVHENEVLQVKDIITNIDDQSQRINVIDEQERRLELKYIGHGQHLKDIQDEFKKHYRDYLAKIDSINGVFGDVKYTIDQLEEKLNRDIISVKSDITDLSDTFDSYKRSNQRSVMDLMNDVTTMKDDITAIQNTLIEQQPEKD